MHRCAFTIVELLVVITITVVLLALLAPALDKAIYEAELAKCASTLRSVASTAIVYAGDFKRRYPHRTLVAVNVSHTTQLQESGYGDIRTVLRGYFSINGHLNCPLTRSIDLDGAPDTARVHAAYSMWFGWQYKMSEGVAGTQYRPAETGRFKGMFRVGDRFTFHDTYVPSGTEYAFDLLASDYDFTNEIDGYGRVTHPEDDGVRAPLVYQTADLYVSMWQGVPQARGRTELNFAYQAGHVQRFDMVDDQSAYDDDRFTAVPYHTRVISNHWGPRGQRMYLTLPRR